MPFFAGIQLSVVRASDSVDVFKPTVGSVSGSTWLNLDLVQAAGL